MDLTNLETAQCKKIGIKQSLKIIKRDEAEALFVAKDAEQYVVRSIVKLAEEKQIPIIYVESMLILGKACNIDVGAATAVIVK
ncbi:50S ribosomal protein L7Ae-like protein [Acidaminobacter sp. JC074]|uniref:ribosomal L7Ae/L30e/S12e/Gadd45 family protein n=1 Tax=Acidaminobacter sp. JC074 TaxID=2530199 RepID=UPI001F0E7BBC|nr:ribosomal L7Ae/L30e/S12e/Gadd45 family protein [Acidaminobacter sp. JC074]MCH4890477.1 50S ribosomal protein L7Ae-like protein [Acidaminobacter sp. JC074]